ncbi:MAG: ATP-binding protein [Campylobacterales bacterium]|nr:ATP-binding protein [Campylobacterales bacterium]
MKSSFYSSSKEIFLDHVDAKEYVQLDRVSTIYQSLKESVKKPLKMILLYGRPGTGKSMMLNKLYEDTKAYQKVVLYHTPLVDEDEFLKSLARDLYGVRPFEKLNFAQFNELSEHYNFETIPLVLLDEAQLYTPALMEKIRLISDARKIKFVIALHKTDKEDIIAKEHFQTRIWESLELHNASAAELKIYVQKKLMKNNCFDVANMFDDKNIKRLHSITHGNYRDTNKLLYSLFTLYDWYEENQPTKINYSRVSTKIIEMAAIKAGFIDA